MFSLAFLVVVVFALAHPARALHVDCNLVAYMVVTEHEDVPQRQRRLCGREIASFLHSLKHPDCANVAESFFVHGLRLTLILCLPCLLWRGSSLYSATRDVTKEQAYACRVQIKELQRAKHMEHDPNGQLPLEPPGVAKAAPGPGPQGVAGGEP
jgi:hypothetical protein